MCEPTTIMMGLAIASSAAGLYGQQQAGKNAKKTADQQNANNLIAYQDDVAMGNRQANEERENISREAFDIKRDAANRAATAKVAAGESGIAGLSVDALLLDLAGKGLKAESTAETNYLRTTQSLADQSRQTRNSFRTATPSARGVNAADVLNAGLNISSAYVKYDAAQKKPT